MAQRDASRIQLDFPKLTADIIAQLRLTGVVGLLEFLDEIRPVYIVASRLGALDVTTISTPFTSASIFDGTVLNAAAGAVILDTGPLPRGDYDIWANMNLVGADPSEGPLALEHRDAANAVTLATLLQGSVSINVSAPTPTLPVIGYTIGLNERLRMINNGGLINGRIQGTLAALIRPTP